jgi:glycerol-3-phosphate dehydrogenase
MMEFFLDDLNSAIPDAGLTRNTILYTFSGLLPATRQGGVGLTKREVILDHSEKGGPRGFYSLSGIKFTTARLVAEKLLKKIFPDSRNRYGSLFEIFQTPGNGKYIGRDFAVGRKEPLDGPLLEALREIADQESVATLDDLLFRRTNLWEVVHGDTDLREKLQQFVFPTKCEINEN